MTLLFYSFFGPLARSWYLSLFSLSFSFTLFFFFFFFFVLFFNYHLVRSSGRDQMIRLYRKIPENFEPLIFKDWFWLICSYGQILSSCIVSSRSHSPPNRVLSFTLFAPTYWIRLLCDRSFCFYHHIIYICYFVAFCLFLLWHSYSLWRCFVLLLEEIQFLS